jgi:Zn-finger nucleic acid-binding protein
MRDRSEWKSPITGRVMEIVPFGDISVHYDSESGGYWLEHGELTALATAQDDTIDEVIRGATKQEHGGRVCPQDNETPLLEFEFGDHSGIKLDICPSCRGMWLDGEELNRLLFYLETHDFSPDTASAEDDEDNIALTDRVLLFLYKLTEHPPWI